MDETTVQSVVASNFQRAFRNETEKVKQRLSLPKERQKYIEQQTKYLEGNDN